jgi:hypothetical protein
LTELFRVFPQLLQANDKTVRELGKEEFITNFLKFVIHTSCYRPSASSNNAPNLLKSSIVSIQRHTTPYVGNITQTCVHQPGALCVGPVKPEIHRPRSVFSPSVSRHTTSYSRSHTYTDGHETIFHTCPFVGDNFNYGTCGSAVG